MRLTLGGTTPTNAREIDYSGHGYAVPGTLPESSIISDNSSWIAPDLSCDLARKETRRGETIGGVYYDTGFKPDHVFEGGGSAESALPSYDSGTFYGLGFSLRTHIDRGYIGGGVGRYTHGLGGKVFGGLQGRGSLFIEVSQTITAHANQPGTAFSLGLRL